MDVAGLLGRQVGLLVEDGDLNEAASAEGPGVDEENLMARCNFCRRKFRNAQSVRAHLRHCSAYQGQQEGSEGVSEEGSEEVSGEGSLPKARLPKSGVPIERDVPMDPLTKHLRWARSFLEKELRFRRIEAIQRKLLEDRNLDPLEELALLGRLQQELERLR